MNVGARTPEIPAPGPGALHRGGPALPALLAARDGVFTLRSDPARPAGFRAIVHAGRHHPAPDGVHRRFGGIAAASAEASMQAVSLDGASIVDDTACAHENALVAARADAFAAGLTEGVRVAEAAFGTRLAELDRLAAALAAARSIDPDALAPALAGTVHALLTELLDADPALEACGLEARARAALAQLAEAHAPAILWLAPAQAAVLAGRLARPALDIVADPTLAAGALRLTCGPARLDDSPAARLASLTPKLAEVAANDPSAELSEDTLYKATETIAR